MIIGRRFSPCQARFRGPTGGGPLRSGPGSAGQRRNPPENPRNRGRAGALRGAPEDPRRRRPGDEDPATKTRRRRTVRPLPSPPGRALRSRRSRQPGIRGTPPPVLLGRVAGGTREAESRRNPGGPGARRPGRRRPNDRNAAPFRAPGRGEGSSRAGRSGLEGDGGLRRPGGDRALLSVSAAGRTGNAGPGTPDRERRTGTPNGGDRDSGGIRASPRRGRSAGFPTSGMGGTAG